MDDDAAVPLFSYGTLRQANVQMASFGRLLAGSPDALPRYASAMIEITDPEVVAASGATFHPMVVETGDPADEVAGTLFLVTETELAAADAGGLPAHEGRDQCRFRLCRRRQAVGALQPCQLRRNLGDGRSSPPIIRTHQRAPLSHGGGLLACCLDQRIIPLPNGYPYPAGVSIDIHALF